MQALMEGPEKMDELTLTRYHRNRMMIDLQNVPEKYKEMIINEYEKEKELGRSALFNFFVSKKLKNLLTDIGDF
jgi:hypothetical protein